MMRRSYILTVLAIFALLITVSLQGCLFGGGGGDEASGGGEAGDGAAPADAGGEMMGGGAEGGAPAADGEMDMGMGGEEMGGVPAAASGAAAAALNVKHSDDWSGAAAQCEAALAANPDDAEAHRVLAWILADTDAAGAIEHFNAYLASGAEGSDADEAKAAIERLK
jgi:hypothetical protein